MENKKIYLTPQIAVSNFELVDIIRTSNKGNDLEWDWDSKSKSFNNKTFSNSSD